MLYERRRRQIPEDFGASRDALSFKSAARNPVTHLGLPLSNGQNGDGRSGLPP
jgi:hypothetical protein